MASADAMEEPPRDDGDAGEAPRSGRRLASLARRMDRNPRLLTAAKLLRQALPGDSGFGDPLSTAGDEQPQLVGRRLSQLTANRPGLLREAGLSALQVWQALSEAQGRGRGDEELTIVFTDLVGFSSWAVDAGDTAALELLRDVGQATEPAVEEHGGEVVKRLGDGMMAVFEDTQRALDALLTARERLAEVEIEGYEPQLRAGMHVGRPRRIGGDYLGVDVNVAARMADHASGDELLISETAMSHLDASKLKARKKRLFRVKGVPKDLATYSVSAKQ